MVPVRSLQTDAALLVIVAALVALGALALDCAVRSLGWPLMHDAPLMHYVAQRWIAGAVPYRDIFDMNVPGIYALHAFVIEVLGPGDAAWRSFDLLWLVATMAATGMLLRPVGWLAVALGVVAVAALHLAQGPLSAGQGDWLLILPMLLAICAWRGPGLRRAAVAGIALGAAALIKVVAVAFAGLLVLSLLADQLSWRVRAARATALLVGVAIP